MPDSNIEPLFVPSAPCANNMRKWAQLEDKLDSVISHRASLKRKREAALPLVRDFCAHCPITDECFEKAFNGVLRGQRTDFTGIAGGALFKEGELEVPFAELYDRRTA